MADKIASILDQIRARYADLRNSCDREWLEAHLRTLASDEPSENQSGEPVPPFPQGVDIAYATCACGAREFIVEGSTQECQHCGRLMFRHLTKTYRLGSGG